MKKILIAIALLYSLTITLANAVEVTPEEKITGLYVAYFDRAADQAGLEFWTDKADEVAQQGGDVSAVFKTLSAGFATHPTFKSTYSDLNNKEFVEAIYRNSLGRDGDAEGIVYWTDLLNRGMSRSDMVATFVELSLVTDLTKENYPSLSDAELIAAQLRQDLITNKVNAALAFTKQLEELSNVENSDDPEQDPAYLASIKIISEVTEDPETVSFVIAFLGSIIFSDDQIRDISEVDSIVNPAPLFIEITVPDIITGYETKSLSAIAIYRYIPDKDITDLVRWTSSDVSIASISGSKVTGKDIFRPGILQIGVPGSVNVTISAEFNDIAKSSQMKVTRYRWWNNASIQIGAGGFSNYNGDIVLAGSSKEFIFVNDSQITLRVRSLTIRGDDYLERFRLNNVPPVLPGREYSHILRLDGDVRNPRVYYSAGREYIEGIDSDDEEDEYYHILDSIDWIQDRGPVFLKSQGL